MPGNETTAEKEYFSTVFIGLRNPNGMHIVRIRIDC